MNTRFLNPLRRLYHSLKKQKEFRNSEDYWKSRYKEGRNSGWGSYDKFAEFKAKVVNEFVKDHDIKSAIEFGCGDGNQCKLFEIDRYVGIDISETVIEKNMREFANDRSKEFYLDGSERHLNAPEIKLALSLDVIYHLIEDDVFKEYMSKLFNYPYVMIYSSNFDEKQKNHVKHRRFSDWIHQNKADWKLIKQINNRFPHEPDKPEDTSPAEFYIFHNTNWN